MEQGHITDRYTKAIEQLGKLDGDNPNIEIRLGAIYALERIAHDSPRDHWTIMEVLTAYVRQNAPVAPIGNPPEKPLPEKPRTDIQAILSVLGRRLVGPKRERPDQHLDLSSTHLQGASLYKANLQGADLRKTNLQRANLTNANLHVVDLGEANLEDASLVEANLQNTWLIRVRLQGADLRVSADLKSANLKEANLQDGRPPRKPKLQCANLSEVSTFNVHDVLYKANLEGADLKKADLRDAKDLTLDQIRSADSRETATLSNDLRKSLGLPPNDLVEKSPTTSF